MHFDINGIVRLFTSGFFRWSFKIKDYIENEFEHEMNNLLLYDNNEYPEFGEIPPEFRPDERNAFSFDVLSRDHL